MPRKKPTTKPTGRATRAALTHLDRRGRVRMVDVGGKPVTRREALARGAVKMEPATLAAIVGGTLKKGEALAAARLAGIMAAKRTHELIPLCHQIPLEVVEVEFRPDPGQRDAPYPGARGHRRAHRGRNGSAGGFKRRGADYLRYGQGDRSRDDDRNYSAGRQIGRPQRYLQARGRAAMAVGGRLSDTASEVGKRSTEPRSRSRVHQKRPRGTGSRRQSLGLLAGYRSRRTSGHRTRRARVGSRRGRDDAGTRLLQSGDHDRGPNARTWRRARSRRNC